MSVQINDKGELMVIFDNDGCADAVEVLRLRREALFNAIMEHNDDFTGEDTVHYIAKFLLDLEFDEHQQRKALGIPARNLKLASDS